MKEHGLFSKQGTQIAQQIILTVDEKERRGTSIKRRTLNKEGGDNLRKSRAKT
jgi:hypothetical protein